MQSAACSGRPAAHPMAPRLEAASQPPPAPCSIYSALDLSGFAFTTRRSPFDWRLLHGVDADEVVRAPTAAAAAAVAYELLHAAPGSRKLLAHHARAQQVRLNDTATLEAIVPALQQGSVDAEPALSAHNYVQLFRLLQVRNCCCCSCCARRQPQHAF